MALIEEAFQRWHIAPTYYLIGNTANGLEGDDHEKNSTIIIGKYEQEGDWKALRGRLAIQELRTGGEASVLAFRRASGACVDARAFLDAVSKGVERTTEIISIKPEGDHIAIVRRIVETGGKNTATSACSCATTPAARNGGYSRGRTKY